MRAVSRDLPVLLRDLVRWGEEASAFVAGHEPEWLFADRTAELALTRLVEVCGEIAGAILRHHPDWCRDREAIGLVSAYRMRNKLAHGYDDVQPGLLFDVADRHLKELVRQARTWRAELDDDERS